LTKSEKAGSWRLEHWHKRHGMAYDVDPDASSLSSQNIQLPFQPRAVTINNIHTGPVVHRER
jgi:hypothetical protein